MSAVEVAAFYAALNGRWPSYPVLFAFAASCDLRMQDMPEGGTKPVRAAAGALLDEHGVTPPGPPKPLGRGKRLTCRYPWTAFPERPGETRTSAVSICSPTPASASCDANSRCCRCGCGSPACAPATSGLVRCVSHGRPERAG